MGEAQKFYRLTYETCHNFVLMTEWRYEAIDVFIFEPIKHGFKYFHNSFYFDSFWQADGFLADVKEIDSAILDGKNQNLYTQKRDIIIQING